VVIETQIVNGTSIIIQEQIDYSWLGIVIASIIALITLIGIILTNQRMKESNDELKKSNELVMLELKHKFEPNLGFSNLGIQYKTDKITADFTCDIKNDGKIAIDEFTIYASVVNKKPTPRSIIDKETEIKTENNKDYRGTFPVGVQTHDFKVTFKESNHENIFIIMWFEFEIMNEKQEIIIYHSFKNLQHDGYDLISNSKIQEIRNNNN